ncbi:AraC family transcriptional regulator [Agrobacterium larrymoorei]|uniref:AraC family transcriptional regulator n=1 Tax=Agrobacterium larrymoorei TaxID=160699 RepID=A0A4D7DRY9_9HYPH|nr:AraC family transcriptional regulator [Agrobacterium larrymoorei]QCI99208.1 AraC family transcriptional regulator [Agrobacterium larrymoorei]QYA08486.1 AraC family transcriptional regulator [Agrobacterium larrymoorei]
MFDRKSENHTVPDPDLISELLMGMRLVGLDYRRIEASAPFGLGFGEVEGRAQFHFVACGPVYLRTASGIIHAMNTGDAVLLPRGGAHSLVSSPDIPCQNIRSLDAAPLCNSVSAIKTCGPDVPSQERVLVFSGCMEFDLGGLHPIVGLMPEVMFVGTLISRYPELLPMLEAMERETRQARAGFAGILARLADVVAAFIVRAWVECGCGDSSGWVAALRDPRLGRVILAIHNNPGHDWSLAELASVMGASRSVFAERFLEITGMTPVRYLTELRMRLAMQWIGRENMPIEAAAIKLGYGSQAAFSRAFKRIIGHPPGSIPARGSGLTQAAE